MIAFLLATFLLQAQPSSAQTDSMPKITLAAALERAAGLDPNYVASLRDVGDAEWTSRAARLAFFTPLATASSSATEFSSEFFNIGTGQLSSRIVDARADVSYDLFTGGEKYHELRRSRAELERAEATELEARFQTALLTESEYYDVVTFRELVAVELARLERAQEQLGIARARVLAGGAVQSDTLRLLLERNRAQVNLLRQRAALRVARESLGRRVGHKGPVDAAPQIEITTPVVSMTVEDAAEEATSSSPRVIAARAAENAAAASVKRTRSAYFPTVDLFAQWTAFDDTFFPNATTRSAYGIRLNVPLWDRGQRELRYQQTKSDLAVAEARRSDTEREVRRDAVRAFEAYRTALIAIEIEEEAVEVAEENLRVNSQRYRTGATTIIDLLTAQVELSEAEVALVQARQVARLALAELEAILGRRLV